ncbi:hypothetical protein [Treponema sp.]|uniref:hypothetical protein n=1 Tax=Treponema sp. TaxID=166 RepID=UPI00298E3D49|nr:hypothetical protein [Treponema sp.]
MTSVLVFAAFTVFAFTGLFSVIDARFYEPGKIAQIQKHLDLVSENYNEYVSTLESRFGKNENSFLKQKSVLSYIQNNPSDDDVRSRSKHSGDLFSQTPGLLGMRLIDKNGTSIHYSTFSTDVLNRTAEIVSYKNYTDSITLSGEKEIPFEQINAGDSYSTGGTNCRTIFDGRDNRIIVSFPFYDSYDAYRGSFVFYVNANDFNRVLLAKKLITFGDTGNLVSGLDVESEKKNTDYKSGFVFGLPAVGKQLFEKEILLRWEKGLTGPEKIIWSNSENTFDSAEYDVSAKKEKQKNNYWVLVSSSKTPFGYIGGVYPDEIFVMADGVKILLLICIFVTVFLAVFLIVNLKQDDMVVIRERIRKLELGLVSEYLKKKENVDWKVVSGKIAERRQDVTLEIIRSLGKRSKKYDKEIKELINKSYDELLAAMNVQVKKEEESSLSNSEQIKQMLEQILSSGTIKVQAANVVAAPEDGTPVRPAAVAAKAAEPDAVEELEEIGDAEPIEEVEEAEAVEEVEELGEVEELEEVEEVESVEEVEDADAVEELEEIDDAESIEDAEPVEEAEAVEEAVPEVVEEVGDAEELESVEPVEEAEAAEAEPVELEDISIDSFDQSAPVELHSPEAEIESSDDVETINRAVSSKKKVYNTDDDQIIDNFSVANPDFTGLDEEEETALVQSPDGSGTQESADENVALDEFGVDFSEDETEFKEEVGFGSPEVVSDEKVPAVDFEVEPAAPDFESLDEKQKDVKIKSKRIPGQDLIGDSTYSIQNIQEEVKNQALVVEDDITELTDKDMQVPFSLTMFCDNAQKPAELEEEYNVIHEDEEGVYFIQSEGHEKEPLDMNFKELVDSVLYKE